MRGPASRMKVGIYIGAASPLCEFDLGVVSKPRLSPASVVFAGGARGAD